MDIERYLQEHEGHIALQFSGGRDSLAMLLHLKPYLDRVTVYYTNSGDAFPETLDLVSAVRSVVPNFVEIEGRVERTRAERGMCADLLPASASWQLASTDVTGHVPLVDKYTCCYLSIMAPMHERMRADGITLILRGQRDDDTVKSGVKNGQVIDGFQIVYPIADWSANDVDAFIKSCGVPVPRYYEAGMTSAPDCMNCTAWLEHKMPQYVKQYHPKHFPILIQRINKVAEATRSAYELLQATVQET